jgi:hypothetical protein
MSVATRPGRIRWKDGKAEELWEFVQERTARGQRITEALKEFADQNGISWLTARWKYYRVRNEREEEPPAAEPVPAPEGAGDGLLEELGAFMKRAAAAGVDLAAFFAALHQLARRAEEGHGLRQRVDELERELDARQSEAAALREQLERVREQYTTLNYLVTDWLNLQSVDRVTSMGDFGRRLRYQVDQFGTVIRLSARQEGTAG